MLCVSQFTKKLHKIMINKLMIEKFKKCENVINEFDYFNFYTFDEFFKNNISYFNDDELKNNVIENMQIFKNYYSCNNDNSIVLLKNVDDDEYIIINFENDIIVHSQNYDIEYVENVDYHNALYDILKTLFCCEYVQH